MAVDSRPRRIWTGLTVPGKKMVKLISERDGARRGQALVGLYKDPPEEVLTAITLALHEVPKQGSRAGPALKNVPIPLSNTTLRHGAVLTDIRDFLRLRFRVSGAPGVQPAPSAAIEEAFRKGDRSAIETALGALPEEQLTLAFNYLVHHLITVLDALTRFDSAMQGGELARIEEEVLRLRDLLRAVLGWLDPDRYNKNTDQAFDDSGA